MPRLIEGKVELGDGQSFREFLTRLREATVGKVVPLLPPAKARPDGSLPYQDVTLADATDAHAIVSATRYGMEEDSFRRIYRVPYTSAAGVVEAGDPEEVEPRVSYEPVRGEVSEAVPEFLGTTFPAKLEVLAARALAEAAVDLRFKLPGSVDRARKLLKEHSGKSEGATILAVLLAQFAASDPDASQR